MHLALRALLYAVTSYMLIGIALLVGWKLGRRARVARLLDGKWGPWLPFGIFWQMGRDGSTAGDTWPLFFGLPALITFRAGQRWTAERGRPRPSGTE